MTNPSNPSELFTPFLPTTTIFPSESDRIASYLVDKFANYADIINDKKIGSYTQSSENFNGNKFIYITTSKVRNGYQSITYIPSYPNNTTLTLTASTSPQYPLTNVNSQFVITNLWGTASKPPSALGAGDGDYIKFNNQGDARVSFTFSDTTIVITTTTDLRAYSGFLVVEYLRDGT